LFYWLPEKIFSFLSKPENLTREELTHLVSIIPNVTVITFIFIGIFAFILAKTKFGQHTYAIGGNINAAERAGVDVKVHLIKVYMISSFFASVAGILLVFTLNMGVHTQYTSSYELFAIAAVVIGGASLTGGKGTIWGTIIGVLLIGTLNNGLMMMGVTYFYFDLFVNRLRLS